HIDRRADPVRSGHEVQHADARTDPKGDTDKLPQRGLWHASTDKYNTCYSHMFTQHAVWHTHKHTAANAYLRAGYEVRHADPEYFAHKLPQRRVRHAPAYGHTT